MSIKRLFSSISAFLIVLVFIASVFGQGTTSRVTGAVTDNAGAAIAGATVSLLNPATNAALTTTTSDEGFYNFELIQPGTYTVTVEKAGFKKTISSNNAALINQPLTVNVVLEVGDVSAVVNVESSSEAVQTSTSGNVGSTIEQRTLESLPIVGLRGRNPLDLLNFQPGVVVGSNAGGGIHVNGSRDRAFNFTLDGIDINESTAGGSNFTPLRPNPDSIQEFQIITSNATAELGRSSGAQVTLVTKSGTNRYSGNVFEYYQTPRFIANESENNLNGIPRRQFVQHIYGFSFGGPVPSFGFGDGGGGNKLLKDKAFFFVNYQRLYATETRLQQTTTYTSLARSGVFRYVVGGANTGTNGRYVPGLNAPAGSSPSNSTNPLGASVNADGSARFPACTGGMPPTNQPCIASYNSGTAQNLYTFDPTLFPLLNSFPLPNNFTRGDGLNTAGFDFNALQLEKQWDLVMRFDYNLNDSNRFYFRMAEGEQNTIGDSVNGGLPAFPGFPNLVDTFRRPKNYAFNYRWSPTAKFTNEAIFGVSRFRFAFYNPEVRADFPYTFTNVTTPFGNSLGNAREARTFQIVDNVTFDLSPHVIKAGVNVRLGKQFDDRSSAGGLIEPQIGFSGASTSFAGFGLPGAAVAGTASLPNGTPGINSTDLSRLQTSINELIGRVGSYAQGFVVDPANPGVFAPAGTRWNWYAYYPEYDFYFQDTWRFRPNLVFDLGLRYEIKLSPSSKDLPILAANQPYTIGAPATNTLRWQDGKLFPNDFNNWGPSVGFAWDPFSNGKTSIRANYRLGYDRFPSQTFANSIYQSAPGNTFAGSFTGVAALNLLVRNPLPSLVPSQSPSTLSQPPAFSTNSIAVLDPEMRYPEVHQWFAGFQHEIGWGSVVEANYIGKRGTHLFGGYDSNQVNISASDPRCGSETFLQAFNTLRTSSTATSCLINLIFRGDPMAGAGSADFRAITALNTTLSSTNTGGGVAAAASFLSQRTCQTADVTAGRCTATSQQLISRTLSNPFFFQRFPQYTGAINVLDTNDYSDYHGLEIILKRRLNSGLGFQVGYTWSVSKDTRSFDPTFTLVSRGNAQSASSTPFDIRDRSINYSWSDFDRRHVLNGTYVYELPFGKGRKFASDVPLALDWLIGGWQLAGTYNWSSGRPFTVYSGINTLSNVTQSFANCDGCPRNLGSLVERNGTNYWFSEEDQARFSQPLPGEVGETGRNYFIGPRRFQTDISLSKKFRITETVNFDLRVDARNLTNTASYGLPTATFNSTVFGRIRDNVISFSRRIQFSGKLNF